MMRPGIVIAAATLAACTHCPQPVLGLGAPRVEDQEHGIPRAILDDSAGLLDQTQVRHGQVVFEPAFSSAHAVWFVQDSPAADAMVFVKVRANDQVQSYSALLDGNTASRLSTLCLASLSSRTETCQPLGRDGVWYHAAHPKPSGSYEMASFWSPRQGTIASTFVGVAEALRNYATMPQSLRSPAWLALQEAANRLSERLATDG